MSDLGVHTRQALYEAERRLRAKRLAREKARHDAIVLAMLIGAIVLVVVLAAFTVHAQARIGAEFQVNTYTQGVQTMDQQGRHVQFDSAGNFVVVWHGDRDIATDSAFGQRFTAAGAKNGAEFQVNSATSDNSHYPNVIIDPASGAFAVAWEQGPLTGNATEIFGRSFLSDGTPDGSTAQVNTYGTGFQSFPMSAARADGASFVVVWRSGGPPGTTEDGDSYGVFARRYVSGIAAGTEFQVNTYTTGEQNSARSGVAVHSNGDFIVVWTSTGQDGSGDGAFGQRYASAGTAVGTEFQVNTYTTGAQRYPDVAIESDGDFIVAWQSNLQDGDSWGVYAQRYTSAGAKSGAEFRVNTTTVGLQRAPTVRCGPNAGQPCFFAWYSGTPSDIVMRCDFAGTMCDEYVVNSYTTGYQNEPSIAVKSDNGFVVVWDSYLQDGSSYGVFGQQFSQPTFTPTLAAVVATPRRQFYRHETEDYTTEPRKTAFSHSRKAQFSAPLQE